MSQGVKVSTMKPDCLNSIPVTANYEQKQSLFSFYLTASLCPSIPSPPSQPVVKRSWGVDSSGKIIQ